MFENNVKTFLMTFPQINQLFQIKENSMSIMLDTYIGIYCQLQTKIRFFFIEKSKDDWDKGTEFL